MLLPSRQVSEYLLEMLKPLLDAPEGMKHAELMEIFYANHPEIPDDDRPDYRIRFSTQRAHLRGVGWLHFDEVNNLWFYTREGREALERYTDPHDLCLTAARLRRRAKRVDGEAEQNMSVQNQTDSSIASCENMLEEEENEAAIIEEARSNFEDARSAAEAGIRNYLYAVNEMVFQDIVADLLRAMGYHVHWVAPPGPDGGVDIMAFTDPIGIAKPIIKVQVKRWKNKVGAPDVKSFSANLGPNDSGIYVCLGGFTWEAEVFARNFAQNLTLISLDQFVRLWISHYDKLTDTAKKRFRLEPVYYVRPEEE